MPSALREPQKGPAHGCSALQNPEPQALPQPLPGIVCPSPVKGSLGTVCKQRDMEVKVALLGWPGTSSLARGTSLMPSREPRPVRGEGAPGPVLGFLRCPKANPLGV